MSCPTYPKLGQVGGLILGLAPKGGDLYRVFWYCVCIQNAHVCRNDMSFLHT